MTRRLTRHLKWGILIPCFMAIFSFLEYQPSSNVKPDESQPFYIQRVIDGDTVLVTQNNQEYKVRMIGVNTPESVSPQKEKNTLEGEIASSFTKSQLQQGAEVYLEFDEEQTDKYGRLLVYIWTTKDCDRSNFEDFKQFNYGAILLQKTYCDAVYYAPNGKYKDWYEQLDKGQGIE